VEAAKRPGDRGRDDRSARDPPHLPGGRGLHRPAWPDCRPASL